MTNGQRYYAVSKIAHRALHERLAAGYEAHLSRADISEADRAWLVKSVTFHKAEAFRFPEFHPGEW